MLQKLLLLAEMDDKMTDDDDDNDHDHDHNHDYDHDKYDNKLATTRQSSGMLRLNQLNEQLINNPSQSGRVVPRIMANRLTASWSQVGICTM